MAARTLSRQLHSIRISHRISPLTSRTYVAVGGRSYTPNRPAAFRNAPPSTPASTNASVQGNDAVSYTAGEIEADVTAEQQALVDIPPESVPSSAVLDGASSMPPPLSSENGAPTDWSRSYFGLSTQPFSKEVSEVLMAPVDPMDVEMKPDGLIYLPEIKYRRVLNKAFGPGGWGLAPRSETNVGPKVVSREYALVCLGRLVAIARGEQEYFDPSGIPTATEACKSNALMRCCKDLGVASELWDPRFIREFKAQHCVEVFAEHLATKKKRKLWRRKDQPKFEYPYKE